MYLVTASPAQELVARVHSKNGTHSEVGVHNRATIQRVEGDREALTCTVFPKGFEASDVLTLSDTSHNMSKGRWVTNLVVQCRPLNWIGPGMMG